MYVTYSSYRASSSSRNLNVAASSGNSDRLHDTHGSKNEFACEQLKSGEDDGVSSAITGFEFMLCPLLRMLSAVIYSDHKRTKEYKQFPQQS
jgi:hypothetical protein